MRPGDPVLGAPGEESFLERVLVSSSRPSCSASRRRKWGSRRNGEPASLARVETYAGLPRRGSLGSSCAVRSDAANADAASARATSAYPASRRARGRAEARRGGRCHLGAAEIGDERPRQVGRREEPLLGGVREVVPGPLLSARDGRRSRPGTRRSKRACSSSAEAQSRQRARATRRQQEIGRLEQSSRRARPAPRVA